jgi:hypothetical protein
MVIGKPHTPMPHRNILREAEGRKEREKRRKGRRGRERGKREGEGEGEGGRERERERESERERERQSPLRRPNSLIWLGPPQKARPPQNPWAPLITPGPLQRPEPPQKTQSPSKVSSPLRSPKPHLEPLSPLRDPRSPHRAEHGQWPYTDPEHQGCRPSKSVRLFKVPESDSAPFLSCISSNYLKLGTFSFFFSFFHSFLSSILHLFLSSLLFFLPSSLHSSTQDRRVLDWVSEIGVSTDTTDAPLDTAMVQCDVRKIHFILFAKIYYQQRVKNGIYPNQFK